MNKVMEKAKKSIDISALSTLAGLSLSEKEKERLSEDLALTVEFADRIRREENVSQEVFFPHGEKNVMRPDIPAEGISREKLLGAAATSREGFITVPLVIDSEKKEGDNG